MVWLETIKTAPVGQGVKMPLKLSRMGVKYSHPDAAVRNKLCENYTKNTDSLTVVSEIVATHFQTIMQASGLWK